MSLETEVKRDEAFKLPYARMVQIKNDINTACNKVGIEPINTYSDIAPRINNLPNGFKKWASGRIYKYPDPNKIETYTGYYVRISELNLTFNPSCILFSVQGEKRNTTTDGDGNTVYPDKLIIGYYSGYMTYSYQDEYYRSSYGGSKSDSSRTLYQLNDKKAWVIGAGTTWGETTLRTIRSNTDKITLLKFKSDETPTIQMAIDWIAFE